MNRQKLLTTIAMFAMTIGTASFANAQSSMSTTTTTPGTGMSASAHTSGSAVDAKADTSMSKDADKSSMTAPAAGDTAATDAKVSTMTKDFITKSAIGGMFEVESSKVALTKATDQKVKDFAQKMIDDHTKAMGDMKTAMTSSPTEKADVPAKLDAKHQKKLDKLNNADTKDFDKDYVNIQVDAHKETIALFEKYADKGDDASLKTFANNTLPTLKEHKSMIDGIKDSMK